MAYAVEPDGRLTGQLKARAALVFNTSNIPASLEDQRFGDPLQRLWKDCVFGVCGVSAFDRCVFRAVDQGAPQQRQDWLEEVRSMVSAYFPR